MYIVNQIVLEHGVDSKNHSYRLSELFLPEDNTRFAYVLEDCERPFGVKVPGETALPRGVYRVTKSYSQRFERDTLQLYTDPSDLSCRHGGIVFTGIRPHGGNTVEDTEGCPMITKYVAGKGKVYTAYSSQLERVLFPILESGEVVLWIIS